MTPLQQHYQRWSKGCGSCHCENATKIVFCRGQLPCDVLFVGEAPGASEDVRGVPFDGPAGLLLDDIIREATPMMCCCGLPLNGSHDHNSCGPPIPDDVRWAFTNLVGCLPHNESGKVEPDADQIKSCRPRLMEFVGIARPRLVVAVGAVAEKHLGASLGKGVHLEASGDVRGHATVRRWAAVVHPAFILRAPIAQKSLLVRRAVVTLANAVEKLGS